MSFQSDNLTLNTRTSYHNCLANRFRVLLTSVPYELMQDLRWQARETGFARGQVPRLRNFLLKIGVQVTVTVRRIVLHTPLGPRLRKGWPSAQSRWSGSASCG